MGTGDGGVAAVMAGRGGELLAGFPRLLVGDDVPREGGTRGEPGEGNGAGGQGREADVRGSLH